MSYLRFIVAELTSNQPILSDSSLSFSSTAGRRKYLILPR